MNTIFQFENMHFRCLQGVYFSGMQKFSDYTCLLSNKIEDNYYNYVALLNCSDNKDFEQKWNEAKSFFKNHNRQPAIYVSPSSSIYGLTRKYLNNFSKQYTDAWMVLEDPSVLTQYKNESVLIKKIDSKSLFETFVGTFQSAYSGDNPDDPYANLPHTYVDSLQNSFNLNNDYKYNHYIAYYKDCPVGVASAISKNNNEYIAVYNVGTITKYREKGIGKSLMKAICSDLVNPSSTMFLQTESGSFVEKWYKGMGFETIFLGQCYTE